MDDSVVVRRIVAEILSQDPDMEVVGVAANGKIALAKIDQVNPDIITLDIEMPELDGLETLKELRNRGVAIPVIMFSTLTERGAEATFDALAAGASDYVTKPANVGKLSEAMQRIREELLPKIKGLCAHMAGADIPPRFTQPIAVPTRRRVGLLPRHGDGIRVLAIGVSTGGPNALSQLLPQLPADLPIPVLLVQHMPPLFTKFLADRLAKTCEIGVREGVQGGLVEPGLAWLAPGGCHMVVQREGAQVRLALNQGPMENSCRPAVDTLFRSVVEIYGDGTLGVIMTGMGQDGLRGCEEICTAGGRVLVQDEASSVVWGMPGFVARAGLADSVLPLDQIAGAILRRVGQEGQPWRMAREDTRV